MRKRRGNVRVGLTNAGLQVINSRVRTPILPFEWRGVLPSPFPIPLALFSLYLMAISPNLPTGYSQIIS
jgi:hypothetical protein